MKITQCEGEGQGSCRRCNERGIFNRQWMIFLYEIYGYEGCYCGKCVNEILANHYEESANEKFKQINECLDMIFNN